MRVLLTNGFDDDIKKIKYFLPNKEFSIFNDF